MTVHRLSVLLAAAVGAFAAGCGVQSVQPLSDPSAAQADDRLLGAWRFRDADAAPQGDIFLHVARDPGLPEGVLACLFVQHSGNETMQPSAATMFTTISGERKFLNVRWETAAGPGKYAFFKYEQQEEELSLYAPRAQHVAAAVRRGELAGSFANGVFGPRVTLRDSSDSLCKFLAHGDDAALFGKDTQLILTRISD